MQVMQVMQARASPCATISHSYHGVSRALGIYQPDRHDFRPDTALKKLNIKSGTLAKDSQCCTSRREGAALLAAAFLWRVAPAGVLEVCTVSMSHKGDHRSDHATAGPVASCKALHARTEICSSGIPFMTLR